MELVENEGFDLTPPESEPPEGDTELALQEDLAGTEAPAPTVAEPAVVGRTYRLNIETGRFEPPGRAPAGISGDEAMRQAVVKALVTSRDSAAVQGHDYGREDAENDAQGQPFDAAAFADLEERTRDALLALPWVLNVQDFDVVEEPKSTATSAIVTFRVVPEGDDDPVPIYFDRVQLPAP